MQGESKMLELRPNCECCDKDLPPESTEAVICTFECTFCSTCSEKALNHICPNCSGNLVQRPIRPKAALKNYPASTKRVLKENGCVATNA
jgi:uncharacterized protein